MPLADLARGKAEDVALRQKIGELVLRPRPDEILLMDAWQRRRILDFQRLDGEFARARPEGHLHDAALRATAKPSFTLASAERR
jgi:hypothetical protein